MSQTISAPTGFFNGSPGASATAQDLQSAITEADATLNTTITEAAASVATSASAAASSATAAAASASAAAASLTEPIVATGSTTGRTLAAWFGDNANIRAFGAVGNGTTNDTAALQAAAASLPNGGRLVLPPGKYLINGITSLYSNTIVEGYGATLIAAPSANWTNTSTISWCAFTNVNNQATTITDSDIEIWGVAFDFYSQFGGNGASHIIQFQRAQNILVKDCWFNGAGDATAMESCNNTEVNSCSAYNFNNCAYDHWAGDKIGAMNGPSNGRVINCFASTASSAQMVNWNPENSSYTVGSGNIADGFVLQGCEFICTGATACPIQLEPLNSGTVARNITVTGNIFKNVALLCRGATRGVTISGNVFISPVGGGVVFAAYALYSGTPDAINFTGNVITDPTTTSVNQAVIVVGATNSSLVGNIISGTQHYAALYLGTAGTTVIGANNFSAGLHGYMITGPGVWVNDSVGISLTNQTSGGSSATGTLTNAPVAGNPSFWLPVTINGSNYYIPAWS